MAYKTIITLMAMFTAITCVATAMTPQLTLPQWQETKITFTQWEPEKNELSLEITVNALDISIENLTCELSSSDGNVKIMTPSHKTGLVKPKQKATFKTLIKIKPETSFWLDVALRGKPDTKVLAEKVSEKYKNQPNLKMVMESEVAQIKDSLYFGRLLPVLARADVALSGVPETTMTAISHKEKKYYMWQPEPTMGRGFEAESLKTFAAAVRQKNHANAEKIGTVLSNRLKSNNTPITIEKANGDSFMIPVKVANMLIKANIATLAAFKDENPEELETFIKETEPSDVRLMAKFNLGQLHLSLNNKGKAQSIFREIAKQLPSWPLLQSVAGALSNGK